MDTTPQPTEHRHGPGKAVTPLFVCGEDGWVTDLPLPRRGGGGAAPLRQPPARTGMRCLTVTAASRPVQHGGGRLPVTWPRDGARPGPARREGAVPPLHNGEGSGPAALLPGAAGGKPGAPGRARPLCGACGLPRDRSE